MVLSWKQYYDLNKDKGTINEIAAQYNMYVYQNEEQYYAELIRRNGNGDLFILQESGHILLQEGINQFGLLQEFGY